MCIYIYCVVCFVFFDTSSVQFAVLFGLSNLRLGARPKPQAAALFFLRGGGVVPSRKPFLKRRGIVFRYCMRPVPGARLLWDFLHQL